MPPGSDPPDPLQDAGELPGTTEGSGITTVLTAEDSAETSTDMELSALNRPTHTFLRLRGEIDVATAPGLRERLSALLRPGMGLVILDLSGVSFCDASGLGVLVGSHRRALMMGVTLRLTALPPPLARLLRIHGLDRVLTIYPALPYAPAWRGTRGG
ncbi:MAG TPA: STAS domain-containing protein [Actinoallomurus sp.]